MAETYQSQRIEANRIALRSDETIRLVGQPFQSRIARIRVGEAGAGDEPSCVVETRPNCASCDAFSPSSSAMSSAPSMTLQRSHRSPLMRSAPQICPDRPVAGELEAPGAGVLQRRQCMPANNTNSGPRTARRAEAAESLTTRALTAYSARGGARRIARLHRGLSCRCGPGASVPLRPD